jgi:hypothetical protein
MNVIQYPISFKYIQHWTIQDALREIYQNAVDAGGVAIEYTHDPDQLVIHNHQGCFEPQDLLLGESTKTNDPNSLGKWGEGLKLGALVCIRNAKEISLIDYNSMREYKFGDTAFDFGDTTIKTLAVEVNDLVGKDVPTQGVNVVIKNVTESEYGTFISSCLMLNNGLKDALTKKDRSILIDPKEQGNIYIGGLYICNIAKLKYGYNFKPGDVTIGRDRNITSDYSVLSQCAYLWEEFQEDERLIEMVEAGTYDVTYISYHHPQKLIDILYARFCEKYGNKIPVGDENEVNMYRSRGYNGSTFHFTNSINSSLLHKATAFIEQTKAIRKKEFRKNMRPYDALVKFEIMHENSLSSEVLSDLSELMELAKNWRLANIKVINVK